MSRAPGRGKEFAPGEVVAERYEILEVTGRGTTGTVYRARDLHVDAEHELVALKVIHPQLHSDRQILGRFRREVKILEKLEGPHLCKLLDSIAEDGVMMIALEYIDGPSLEDYLRERDPLQLSEVVTIMAQVCDALQVAHDANVVHRDLKPSNVLIEGVARQALSGDGTPLSFLDGLSVRVVDFGLAKIVQGDISAATVLTEQDMIFGTPDYMAPEQVSGEELDGRCDVYAAGVILYEMLVGKLPFDTPGPLTTMTAHLNTPVPEPSESAPERAIPKAVERVVLKALAKEPGDRYATARELGEALALAASEPVAADIADTALDHAAEAVNTTLASHRDSALEAMKGKGARVKVVVSEAPSSSETSSARSSERRSPSRRSSVHGERRFWTWVAVLAAIAAVAAGIWLGVR